MHLLPFLFFCSVSTQSASAIDEFFVDIDPHNPLLTPKSCYCEASKPDNLTYKTPDVYGIELKNVVVIARHGDRTPITDLRVAGNDFKKWHELVDMEELKNDLPDCIQDENVGLLTRKGQKQLERLGSSLRSIYVDKLGAIPGVFDDNMISLRSTNFSRTFLSTKHLISGFYPETHPAVFLDRIKVQAHRRTSLDSLLVADEECKRLKEISRSSQLAPGLAEMHDEMRLLLSLAKDRWKLKELMTILSYDQPKLVPRHPESDGFFEISDVFFCNTCHPGDEVNEEEEVQSLGQRFIDVSRDSWKILQGVLVTNPQHSRLRSGLLISELLEYFQDGIDEEGQKGRLMILGAHDTTLAHLHGALGSGISEWPAYASNLIFELWSSRDSSQWYVRTLYNGEVVQFPWSASELVPWGEFVAYSHHLVPVDYATECLVY